MVFARQSNQIFERWKEIYDVFKAKPKLANAIYFMISIAFMIIFPILIVTSNRLLGVLVGLLAVRVINFLLIGAED